jgi:hypothetical protein
MKKAVCFLILILFLNSALALSVSPGKVSFIFEPGLKTGFGIAVGGGGGADSLEHSIIATGNELEKAITLGEFKDSGDGAALAVDIDFTKVDVKKVIPGKNRILIEVKEKSPGEGQFAALVAIRVPINIFVPFEGIFFDVMLDIKDIEVGEQGQATAVLRNLGSEKVNVSSVFIVLANDVEKLRVPVNGIVIEVNEEKKIVRNFDTSNFAEGKYFLKFIANVGSNTVEKTKEFRIGKWLLDIASIKQEYQANKEVEQFVMQVSNGWNEEAENAYAEFKISNESTKNIVSKKTATFNVPASSMNKTTEVKEYFDTSGIAAGKYTLNATIFFKDSASSKLYDVQFVKKGINIMWIAIGAGVVAAAGIIFWMMKKKKGRRR